MANNADIWSEIAIEKIARSYARQMREYSLANLRAAQRSGKPFSREVIEKAVAQAWGQVSNPPEADEETIAKSMKDIQDGRVRPLAEFINDLSGQHCANR